MGRLFDSVEMPSLGQSKDPFAQHLHPNTDSDDDDDWGDRGQYQPTQVEAERLKGWRYFLCGGGLGQFLFSTSLGWYIFVGILGFWLCGCEIIFTLVNRTIVWSAYLKENYTAYTQWLYIIAGVYKFPYPLITVFLQMVLGHCLLILSACVTRWKSTSLKNAGLSGMIAPSTPLSRSHGRNDGAETRVANASGGIAGGGLFEFELRTAKQVFPLALVLVMKLWLSSLSSLHSQFSVYALARIGTVPLSFVFTSYLNGSKHSQSLIITAFMATLSLGLSLQRPVSQVAWNNVLIGVVSSIFVALYPIQISRTYKFLLTSLVPQGHDLSNRPTSSETSSNFSGTEEESRAYWLLLHYTSVVSILLFTPIVLISGEIMALLRNFHNLDVFFHWLMVSFGGLGSWAVFFSTIALTRGTSPLTTTFLSILQTSVLWPMMMGKRLMLTNWVALAICWTSCGWFIFWRINEGRSWERFN